ncbi:FMN-dependent NADH-azoreductase [Geobacter sp. FeAm09]|uniref:FMN-dependent NADH-azoreductase n=1 Tax=Geobacter sp. FeAm09 TaxID=2597769 RepID=UPI0011EC0D10|nr:NAD(P)H-dependent oxidoreductase [Geobacter sp. FeAm09]QEM68764.1 FMN-dependent NADH-azoreductase [Geobacter sp. FeAm09]
MAKLLYVTCNLKPVEHSRSLSIGKVFLNKYVQFNPQDEIAFLDLYRDNIQRIDTDVLNGWEKIRGGGSLASLNDDEKRKIGRIWRHVDQFVTADKYLFVTPMFNLGFPAEFKIYIDTICVDGMTFTHTPAGPVGLLKDQGRKCLHIHSTGDFHFGKDDDYSVPYLRSIMHRMGIDDFEAIVIEGCDRRPDLAEQFRRAAVEKALDAATRF